MHGDSGESDNGTVRVLMAPSCFAMRLSVLLHHSPDETCFKILSVMHLRIGLFNVLVQLGDN